MTSRSTWKQRERQIAKYFGGERVPLSGGNSKITRADVFGAGNLFVEAKLRARDSSWTLWDKTNEIAKAESKVPVLAICMKHRPGFLVVCHCDDLEAVAKHYLGTTDD